jgi:hypothetical protein
MKKLRFYTVGLLIIICCTVNGQANKGPKFCAGDLLGKAFISDGQDHSGLVRKNKSTKFNIVFYPQFRYKLIVCSNNLKEPLEITLKDSNGKIFFTNANKDYIREWEFQYSSLMNATIEIKLVKKEATEENIRLILGYKPI